MIKATTRFDGIPEVRSALKQLKKAFPNAAGYGMYVVAAHIMRDAKSRTPVDTGALRASGYASEPKYHQDGTKVTIGFGGKAAQYAVIQHENELYKHTVGEHHFLLKAINAALSYSATAIKSAVTRYAKKGSDGKGPVPILGIPTSPWRG